MNPAIPAEPLSPIRDTLVARRAAVALLLACLFWGGSFAWAKSSAAMINLRAGVAEHSTLGTMLLLAWRFTLAGVAWMILFPAARRGWSRASLINALSLGLLF